LTLLSTTIPFLDPETDKVFVVLVAKIDDASYRQSCVTVAHLFESLSETGNFKRSELIHRRSCFPAVNVGTSYGQGSKKPANLRHHDPVLVERLLQDKDVQHLATYGSYSFLLWVPYVYTYYKDRLDSLFKRMPQLQRNFGKSMFPRAAFNFGSQVCTVNHHDCMNCPFGWCTIHALGEFNHRMGGHLVLPDLKLVIEFPPRAVVLMPSATLTHSNTKVSNGET
ncbi:hypothetical protein FA15DRAFT_720334, partial [Coprinopsis marcescibilis]